MSLTLVEFNIKSTRCEAICLGPRMNIAVVSGVIEKTFDFVRNDFSVLSFVRFGGFHEVFICLKISRNSRAQQVLSRAHRVREIATNPCLTSVVRILLWGASGSLPTSASILSCLGEDFLAGCWQTNKLGQPCLTIACFT